MVNDITQPPIASNEHRAAMYDAINKSLEIFSCHREENFDDVMTNGLRPLAAAMEVQRIVVYRIISIGDTPHLQQAYRWDSVEGGLTATSLFVLPNSHVIKNWFDTAKQDICINQHLSDMSQDEVAFLSQFGIKSHLIVPVFSHGRLWGSINFQDHANERHFDEGCMDIYRSAARLCVNAIIRADMTQKAHDSIIAHKRREKMMETLVQTAIIFFSRSETLSDDMMTVGIGLIADMVDVDTFAVWRNITKSDGLHASQIYHWNRASGGITTLDPKLQDIAYHQFSLPLEEIFVNGEFVNTSVSLLSETSIVHSLGIKSLFLTPVLSGNTLWGFVAFLDSHCERHFDNDSVEMMRSAAFFVANAVMRAEMAHEIAAKNELNRVMFDTAPVGLTMFDGACNIVDCNEAVLNIFRVSKQYYLDHFYELSPTFQPDGANSREKIRNIMQQTLQGKKLVLEWTHKLPSDEQIPCEITLASTTHQGKILGLIYVYDLRNVKNMQESIQKLEAEVLKIYVDPLTGIHNRRFFTEHLEQIMKSLSRSYSTLSLLMIDIDDFKQFNDTYGHVEGDICLKTISHSLSKNLARADDFVARFGGEEFAVVLPNTDANGARMVAEKLCESIRKCNILHAKSRAAKCVTISIGGVTGKVDRTQSGDDYVKQADEMLYLSKRNGRNQYSLCAFSTSRQTIGDDLSVF